MKKPRQHPLPVNEDVNYWDRLAKEMTRKGFGGKLVAKITGLKNVGRVYYRNKKFGVSSLDWRRGEGQAAEAALQEIQASLKKIKFLHRDVSVIIKKRRGK